MPYFLYIFVPELKKENTSSENPRDYCALTISKNLLDQVDNFEIDQIVPFIKRTVGEIFTETEKREVKRKIEDITLDTKLSFASFCLKFKPSLLNYWEIDKVKDAIYFMKELDTDNRFSFFLDSVAKKDMNLNEYSGAGKDLYLFFKKHLGQIFIKSGVVDVKLFKAVFDSKDRFKIVKFISDSVDLILENKALSRKDLFVLGFIHERMKANALYPREYFIDLYMKSCEYENATIVSSKPGEVNGTMTLVGKKSPFAKHFHSFRVGGILEDLGLEVPEKNCLEARKIAQKNKFKRVNVSDTNFLLDIEGEKINYGSTITYLGQNRYKELETGEGSEELYLIEFHDITELQNLVKENKILSVTDGLTGLYTRRYFDIKMEEQIKLYERQLHKKESGGELERPFSLLMIDIDFFKAVNDNYGHLKGDEVLKNVGEALKNISRKSDIVAKYGGEEFVLILPETDTKGACVIAEKIRNEIQQMSFNQNEIDEEFSVTVSIGVSQINNLEKTYKQVVGNADSALYSAKESGRNQTNLVDGDNIVDINGEIVTKLN